MTGGAGFIGSNFIAHVLEKYGAVRMVCVDKLGYAGNLENLSGFLKSEALGFEKLDICNEAGMRTVFERERPDTVVHFAAESHVDRSIMSARPFVESNILGTQILLDLCRQFQVQCMLHVSTDEVYGALSPGQAASLETDSLDPTNPYSASKASSDLMVLSYVKTHDFPALVTRCSNNYGPYQFPEKFIPLAITNAIEDKPIPIYGDGLQVRDWIFVRDHCEAIWRLITHGKTGEIYNIGGHNQPTNIEIARQILTMLGKPESLLEHIKDRPAHDRRYNLDDAKLMAETAFKERVSVAEGLRHTVAWYVKNEPWWRRVKSGEYQTYYERQYVSRK